MTSNVLAIGFIALLCFCLLLAGCGTVGGGGGGGSTSPGHIIADGLLVGPISLSAGETVNVATIDLDMAGGRKLLAMPTISNLTFPPAPAEYGGKNHTLHVDVTWKILVSDEVIASYQQTAEQNHIQLQAIYDGPTRKHTNPVILQAVNASYWSLDDAPTGTTPTGTNSFHVNFVAMEFDEIISAEGVASAQTGLSAGASVNVATIEKEMIGGRKLLAVPTISNLTFPPAPAEYGGKNHTLHVDVTWKVLVSDEVIASYQQTAEQNHIQLQAIYDGPTRKHTNPVILQAVNASYWSLDDAPTGTTPTGTNNFKLNFSVMEFDNIITAEGGSSAPSGLDAASVTNVGSLAMSLTGDKKLLALPTISNLTFPGAPSEYGGKNHTLHVNVTWEVLVNDVVIGSYQQTAEQNHITLQALDSSPTHAGDNTVTLRAFNGSYWSLDDSPYGTTTTGTNNFKLNFSAMEF